MPDRVAAHSTEHRALRAAILFVMVSSHYHWHRMTVVAYISLMSKY